MSDKISFQFLTIKAEAQGIRAVRIIALITLAGMFTLAALSVIWTSWN